MHVPHGAELSIRTTLAINEGLTLVFPANFVPLNRCFQRSEQIADVRRDVVLHLGHQPINITSESDGTLPFTARSRLTRRARLARRRTWRKESRGNL